MGEEDEVQPEAGFFWSASGSRYMRVTRVNLKYCAAQNLVAGFGLKL